MERPNKRYLTKEEFKLVYPEVFAYWESLSIIEHPEGKGRINKRNGKFYLYRGKYVTCSICGKPVFYTADNFFKDLHKDGTCRHSECVDHSESARKGYDGMTKEAIKVKMKNAIDITPEQRSERVRKAIETMGTEGLSSRTRKRNATVGREKMSLIASEKAKRHKELGVGIFSEESRAKSAKTQRDNGNYGVDPYEDVLIQFINDNTPYTAVHAPHDSYFSDGTFHTKEIDIYIEELKIGLEIDEYDKQHHYEGKGGIKIGYHYEKDQYFKDNFGIDIYHITFRNPNYIKYPGTEDMNIYQLILHILSGEYKGPKIMVNDATYGPDIYYPGLTA